MKKTKTILIASATVLILLVGCAKIGIPKENDPTPTQENIATAQVTDEILSSLDNLTKTQDSQIEVTDADLILP